MREAARAVWKALESGEAVEAKLAAAGIRDPAALADDLRAVGPKALGPEALDRAMAGPDPEGVLRGLRRHADAGGALEPPLLDLAIPLFGHSAEAARFFAREPALLRELAASPYLRTPRPLASMREALEPLPEEPALAMAALRRFRKLEHARIAWRDVTGAAPMPEILAELSDVAEAILDAAVTHALAHLAREHGEPTRAGGGTPAFAVLGCGKLGGRELNFSSDVDVLYVYETDEGGVGGAELTLYELFSRVARLTTRLVGEATHDGIAFRVDLTLRPEGKRGPLVNSLPAFLSYYETWGQTWERAALLKARPVGGDRALGEKVLEGLTPFIYRRVLDQSVVEEIHGMKARIDADERRRGGSWNIKLGRGGIRELEFFAQAHQLLLGGKRERLRVRGTLEAFDALAEEGVLASDEAAALRDSYLFLRRLEHRLQMHEGLQVHRMPAPLQDRARLARAMGHVREVSARNDARVAAALEREVLRHRRVVMSAFDGLFHGAEAEEAVLPPALADLEDGEISEEARAVLRGYGLRDAQSAWESLAQVARTRDTPFHARAPARVRALAPDLLSALTTTPDPDLALRHASEFLRRMRGRWGTFALLRENPGTLKTLLDLFGTSDFLAKLVVQRPELLDPLVIGVVAPRRSFEDALAEIRSRTAGVDDEERLDAWRRFQAQELLRIGLADVTGTLDLLEVQAELTVLAEALITEALAWGAGAVRSRPGLPVPGDLPLCVVGLGKLGGRELNYNSDLDLCFLYREGPQEHYSSVAQKLLFGLSCFTSEGFLYRIDARLRPSGRHGSLVSSIPAFAQYHEASAAVWERLALVRARPVAGPEPLRAEAQALLWRAAYGRPWPEGGAREIDRLRGRMETELAREGPDRYNVKLGRGGLTDVEFATQLLQLRVGGDVAEVRRPGTYEALGALQAAGAWDAGDLALLRNGYLWLRRLENRLRIVHDNAQSVLSRDPDALEVIARRMGFREGGTALLKAYEEVTSLVRQVYRRVVEAMP